MLKTFDEMCNDGSICKYCSVTDWGQHTSGVTPGGYWSCECSWCKEAYDLYLDDKNTTENIIKYASKVKLINKENFYE